MKLCETLKVAVSKHYELFAIVLVQLSAAGMALISKVALNDGISPLVFNVYRQAISTVTLTPFAFWFERKMSTTMSFSLFCKIFLAALCGPTATMDLFYLSLRITSATFATAVFNSCPVITFICSILLGMETVGWSSFYGGLKITGVVVTVGGAVMVSFFRHPASDRPLHVGSSSSTTSSSSSRSIIGPVLMFLSTIAWSTWLIIHSKLLKLYPARLRLCTMQFLLSTIQCSIIAAAFEGQTHSWKIGWNIQLAFLVYSGVVATGVSYGLQTWCIEKKGPFYVAMFSPLSLLITAIISAFVWGERLNCGSIMGGILIICGLYCVLWGRSKEGNQVACKSEHRERPELNGRS